MNKAEEYLMRGQLEPQTHCMEAHPELVAAVSTAISLKRIADVLEGTPERLSLVAGIMQAIEQGIFAARQSG